jgi:hypothetical protein
MSWRSWLVAVVLGANAAFAAFAAPSEFAAGFAGSWRLERITDGKRVRTHLDERLTLRVAGETLELDYRIVDRFGARTLRLKAPLDGTPLEQTVQARHAVVAARLDSDRLVLSIERDAPFGYIHNRRSMQLTADGRRLESYRENLKRSGSPDSAWRETWVRVVADRGSANHR